MDMNSIMGAVKEMRKSAFRASDQISLGNLISELKACINDDEKKTVGFDFEYLSPCGVDSYRGYYDELAIEFHDKGAPTLSAFIQTLEEAVGQSFQGYKGGDYTMSEETPVWVANYGHSGDTGVVGVLDDGYRAIILTKFIKS